MLLRLIWWQRMHTCSALLNALVVVVVVVVSDHNSLPSEQFQVHSSLGKVVVAVVALLNQSGHCGLCVYSQKQ